MFWVAVTLECVIATVLLAALTRIITSWLFAFPLLLFEESAPHQALRISAKITAGHRKRLVLWIAGWAVSITAISAIGTGLVGLLGRALLQSTKSLSLLVFLVGVVLLMWTVVNFVVTLLSSTTFSVLLVNLYRTLVGENFCPPPHFEIPSSTGAVKLFNLSRRDLLRLSVTAVIAAGVVGVVPQRA